MPGTVFSRTNISVADDYSDPATFIAGNFDKLDVTAYNGDVLYQVRTLNGDWQPAGGSTIRKGLFRSVPGFSTIYPPGPVAVRFKRATPGVGAVVDFDLYSPDPSS